MQTGNNDMDKKLRQLENQSLPDLTRLDQHWQQMRQMIQPAIVPVPKTKSWLSKWKLWVAAASILTIFTAIVYTIANRKKQDAPVVTVQPVPALPKTLSPDTISVPVAAVATPATTISTQRGLTSQRHNPPVAVQVTPVFTDTAAKTPAATNQPANSKKETVTLAGFFKQLEKETQEFVIDPRKDTLIHGNSGTTLFIPANTFATASLVTVLLREYYTYEDIITNRLTTCSDNKQLVTGGMLHLSAYSNGKEAGLARGKSIRWYVPDTTAAMIDMQLFTGQVVGGNREPGYGSLFLQGDSLVPADNWSFDQINWIPQPRMFTAENFRPMVKVLDLRNEPYSTYQSKKGLVGRFLIAGNSELDAAELKKALMDKYGYAKVILRREKDRHRLTKFRRLFSSKDSWVKKEGLGDSTWVYPEVAKAYRLTPTDTSKPNRIAAGQWGRYNISNSFSRNNQAVTDTAASGSVNFTTALADRFSVDISTLGWINCDRFYNDKRNKIPFYVDLKDTAANYYTFLVFDRIKSMMPGAVNGTKVLFSQVPEGEKARIVCVGIKDGKAIAAVEPVELNRAMFTGMKFEETSPAAFREQAAMTDK